MKTRIVHTKIWSDSFYSDLQPLEKFLFLYFITNESVNIIHCYECPDKKVMFDTGVTKDQLVKAKEKFEDAGKIFFKNGFVCLRNAGKYETYSGSDNEKAIENIVKLLDPEIADWYNQITSPDFQVIHPSDRGLTGVGTPPINHNTEIRSKKSEIRNKKRYSNIEDLTEEDFERITQLYNVTLPFVRSKHDDLVNYCGSKGKTYRNYYLALCDWVKRDAITVRKEAYGKPNIAFINPQ